MASAAALLLLAKRLEREGDQRHPEEGKREADVGGASKLVTANIGYTITPHLRFVVEGLNLLNATVSDIDYYYVSRLRGEPPTA